MRSLACRKPVTSPSPPTTSTRECPERCTSSSASATVEVRGTVTIRSLCAITSSTRTSRKPSAPESNRRPTTSKGPPSSRTATSSASSSVLCARRRPPSSHMPTGSSIAAATQPDRVTSGPRIPATMR